MKCPICSSNTLRIFNLKGSRTGKENPLYFCIKCTSFFQRPNYHEDDETLRRDLQWHLGKHEEHKKQATAFSVSIWDKIGMVSKVG